MGKDVVEQIYNEKNQRNFLELFTARNKFVAGTSKSPWKSACALSGVFYGLINLRLKCNKKN